MMDAFKEIPWSEIYSIFKKLVGYGPNDIEKLISSGKVHYKSTKIVEKWEYLDDKEIFYLIADEGGGRKEKMFLL